MSNIGPEVRGIIEERDRLYARVHEVVAEREQAERMYLDLRTLMDREREVNLNAEIAGLGVVIKQQAAHIAALEAEAVRVHEELEARIKTLLQAPE